MSDFEDHTRKSGRLVILRALDEMPDGRMNESDLTLVLDTFGYRKSRDWVRTQMRAMAELGVVRVVEATPTFLIAELTATGKDHVDRRVFVEGVARPSPR